MNLPLLFDSNTQPATASAGAPHHLSYLDGPTLPAGFGARTRHRVKALIETSLESPRGRAGRKASAPPFAPRVFKVRG
ncbi:hypothetical protein [Synoicihabitans lomoniglobus]|uniref:Uncharacterized protein n=1 Tax=Synoicihabitans lomoniglobus TaxID=2909285 RepID=A0AAF0I4N5_9BACT|nr:hypothetical protein [Opitutaceae bacterium LMO-M01]WED66899.1 hypothetical protein PXH66_08555 [Opitutaceae bacterium LMO-M01]